MNWKKITALLLALGLGAALMGCGGGSAVYVQSVKTLASLGGIAPGDTFTGLVVSEHVTEITRDQEKTIKELKVREGDDVKAGQELFSYDTEELLLTLDKQELERKQLVATIENYKQQIKVLEKERLSAGASLKLQYTIEIQSMQVDLKEAELNLKTKADQVAKSEDLLNNATVFAPVDGRIQALNEKGTDMNGNELPYITIQQVGSYRIKGLLGELQRGGLKEGDRVTIYSRTDPGLRWGGTITLVDYESPYQGSDYDRYYGTASDEMSASSRYPFYVQLDTTEGLILGQHIYMELEREEAAAGLSIGSAFIAYEEDGSPYVWAEKGEKLTKRPVTLGEYNPMTDTMEVREGLTEEDFIAFPDPELCREGAPTTHSQAEETLPPPEEGGV